MEAFSSVDKNLVSFKIQLGALRKGNFSEMDEKVKDIEGVENKVLVQA